MTRVPESVFIRIQKSRDLPGFSVSQVNAYSPGGGRDTSGRVRYNWEVALCR